MVAHNYLGVIAGITLLLHGGAQSGGALTTALMISFDLAILTGLFGAVCYFFAPRLLTKIEGQPLLLDDLTARREELADEIRAAGAPRNGGSPRLIERAVPPPVLSFCYPIAPYFPPQILQP